MRKIEVIVTTILFALATVGLRIAFFFTGSAQVN